MVRLGGYALPEEFDLDVMHENDQPDLMLHFRVRGDRVECSSVTVEAKDDGREVQSQDLRAIKVLDLLEHAVQLAAGPITTLDGTESNFIIYSPTRLDDRGAVREAIKGRRKRRVTPENLAKVAAIVEVSEDPVTAVEEEFGVGLRAAQLWLKRAHDQGYVPPKGGES